MTKAFKLQPATVLESGLQGQILDYLAHEQTRGRVAWYCRVNGGGTRLKGVWLWFYRLHLPGKAATSKGKTDIEGMLGKHSRYPGRYFALEVKRPGEVATDEQLDFIAAVSDVGGIAATVRSFEDVRSVLFEEMDPARDQTPYEVVG